MSSNGSQAALRGEATQGTTIGSAHRRTAQRQDPKGQVGSSLVSEWATSSLVYRLSFKANRWRFVSHAC